MCVTCGCSDQAQVTYTRPGEHPATPDAPMADTQHTHVLPDGTIITHTHAGESHNHDHHHHHHQTHHHQSDHHDHHRDQRNHHPRPEEDHPPTHPSTHPPIHSTLTQSAQIHAQAHISTLTLEQNLLSKNNLIAAQNRGWLKGRHITALNLVSSPGAGKTTLLVRTIQDLQAEIPIAVIEGDQETAQDAERIAATGCPAIQVNTGTGCHLEAAMIERGLEALNPPTHSLVLIENVGNLVCPALFDLGEKAKVVMLSVTEGEDKPIKYPHMFRASQVMVLTKTDLLPYVNFDVNRCLDYARQVNPDLKIFQVSAVSGEGLSDWYAWLKSTAA
ncbi:MAG: hydrogenase nickel incorporation protein HypB [Synechococcales bacterium]|nr:hydrogenase nickel incorporation protein HypB [Synechococcales bacterium]